MMDVKVVLLLVGACVFLTPNVQAGKHKMVVYWGQNAVYNQHREPSRWEKPLSHFCTQTRYDVVVLAFMHIFFDGRQKDSMPALNFAFHCEKGSAEYPFLLRCPKIEAAIKQCQANGKQVLISLGGAVGGYGFKNDGEAKQFAGRVWNLMLGGSELQALRPFGTAQLDGVDLDIEGGHPTGYSAFIRELRQLEKGSGKHYIIGAAPQCPFPDAFLGPAPGKAFGDVPTMIDEIYIQFYNNYCQTGDAAQFYPNLRQWLDYSAKNNGPMIYVGMPSDDRAAYQRGNHRSVAEVRTMYNKIKDEPRFGGFMLWDASFDQNNVINGRSYSDHLADILGSGPSPTGGPITRAPVTRVPVTKGPVTDSPATKGPATKAPKTGAPTKPSTVSCAGRADGFYSHQSDCAKFFQCVGGVSYVKSCPAGLHFNPKMNYCDWPANVDC